jgi:hypothetical protein
VAGQSGTFSNRKAAVLKFDSSGTLIWSKAFAPPSQANAITESSDQNFILVGNDKKGHYLVKLNSTGNVLWKRKFGTPHDLIGSIHPLSDGGCVVGGTANVISSNVPRDALAIGFNSNGNIVWKKTFGGSGNDGANSISGTIDGGNVLAGYTYSYGTRGDVYVVSF